MGSCDEKVTFEERHDQLVNDDLGILGYMILRDYESCFSCFCISQKFFLVGS
jgi:hypothetical protein